MRLLALCALLLLAACSPASSPAGSTAAPSAVAANDFDILGDWVISHDQDPPPGPKRIQLACFSSPAHHLIRMAGGEVSIDLDPGRVARGNQPMFETIPFETAKGRLSSGRLTLTGTSGQRNLSRGRPSPQQPAPEPVTYELAFDARTGHLAGTRNGKPVWFARPVLVEPAGPCAPVP